MKKLKILLSTLAVTAAIVTTFATHRNSALALDGYQFIPSQNLCKKYSNVDCVAPNETTCVISGIEMRESPSHQAQCGQALGQRN